MSGEQKADLIPVRVSLDYTLAVTREQYEAGEHFDLLWAGTEGFEGVFHEGGAASEIEPKDLIDGSPLAVYLLNRRDFGEITAAVVRCVESGTVDLDCRYCQDNLLPTLRKTGRVPFAPRHRPSSACRSGSRPHCTCDACF